MCQQCGIRIDSISDFCGHCLHHPPAFSRSCIPFAYQHPLDHLIHKFKYRRNLTSGKLLGRMLADYLTHHAQHQNAWVSPDLIIPTPMHWLKRWQRGFNQAEVMGRYVAQELAIPLATNIIKRIQDKRIALLDDVVTTTATVRELSQLLIKAGAKDVQVWALARTM
ncbi:MAG: ComF family protein [Moraxellaceae bacterium]|nr:MAG: ComF family protein [Moraxellaceae bacterium]